MRHEQRILRLEREAKYSRTAAVVLGTGLVLIVVLGAAPDDGIPTPDLHANSDLEPKTSEPAPTPKAVAKVEFVEGTIRAHRLEIVDDGGQVVLEVGGGENGGYLIVRDNEALPAIGMGCGEKNNFLALYNQLQDVGIQLVNHHDRQGGGLEIYNSRRVPVAVLTCGKTSGGLAWVRNADGSQKWIERGE